MTEQRLTMARQIASWITTPQPGLTCPCGFKGHHRNITSHRRACETWTMMLESRHHHPGYRRAYHR